MAIATQPAVTLSQESLEISEALRSARRRRAALNGFPGPLPKTLKDAYAIQLFSLKAWDQPVSGWKVGGVHIDFQTTYGAQRLAGPIFRDTVYHAKDGDRLSMPVFKGGFAAIEAEFVVELGDVSSYQGDGSCQGVLKAVQNIHIGVEIASSPMRMINDLGPAAVISDFGNNHGLILGPAIEREAWSELEKFGVDVEIDGQQVGQTRCAETLAGPLGAAAFLIEHLRRENIAAPAGTLVSTGAVTGVHEAPIGAKASVHFETLGRLHIELVAA